MRITGAFANVECARSRRQAKSTTERRTRTRFTRESIHSHSRWAGSHSALTLGAARLRFHHSRGRGSHVVLTLRAARFNFHQTRLRGSHPALNAQSRAVRFSPITLGR